MAKMRMLRWMNVNILKDRIRNKCIYKKLEVTLIQDTMRETWLSGLGMCNEYLYGHKLEKVIES